MRQVNYSTELYQEEEDTTNMRQIIRHVCNIIFKLHTSDYTSNQSIIERYNGYQLTEEDKYWVDKYAAFCIPDYSPSPSSSDIIPLPRAITELVHLTESWTM